VKLGIILGPPRRGVRRGEVRDSALAHSPGNRIIAATDRMIANRPSRDTISANFQDEILSSGANSLVRTFLVGIRPKWVSGVTAAGASIVHSSKNSVINGNVVDGTPIVQENLN
jgi:hypothetical protein